MEHVLKVEPNSGAENRLQYLFTKSKNGKHKCYLGEVVGLPYNKYEFDDVTFDEIKEYLKEEKGLS